MVKIDMEIKQEKEIEARKRETK